MTLGQRLFMVLFFMFTDTHLVYVWFSVRRPQWYDGLLAPRLGRLVPDSLAEGLMEFENAELALTQ